MPQARYGVEHVVGIGEEATYGTALADNSDLSPTTNMGGQLLVEPTDIDSDYKHIANNRASGYTFPVIDDLTTHTAGSVPKITMVGDVVDQWIDILTYSWFQTVTEDAGSPFKKTLTIAQPAPDFSNDDGLFHTIWYRSPTASGSEKITSAVCQNFTLSADKNVDDGRLKFSADWIGQTYTAGANPSGTWTRLANEYLYLYDSDFRLTLETNDMTPYLQSFELKFTKDVQFIGVTSDTWQNLAFFNHMIELKVMLMSDTATRTELARQAGTSRVDINIGWGHATPGTDDGDLDYELNGVAMASSKLTRPDVESIEVNYKAVYDSTDSGAEQPVTAIMANAVDRAW